MSVKEEPPSSRLSCSRTSNHSKPFALGYCRAAAEHGVFDSEEACMEAEGEKLAKFLDENPLQERFITPGEKVEAATEVSNEIPGWLGTSKGYAKQYRYPDMGGDIHMRVTETEDLGVVHQDTCPPGEAPGRHFLNDLLLS